MCPYDEVAAAAAEVLAMHRSPPRVRTSPALRPIPPSPTSTPPLPLPTAEPPLPFHVPSADAAPYTPTTLHGPEFEFGSGLRHGSGSSFGRPEQWQQQQAVGRCMLTACKLTVSKPELKVPLVLVLDTRIS